MIGALLQGALTPDSVSVVAAASRVLGLGVLAGVTAGTGAFVFRWYAGDGLPDGVAILLGLSAIALWLNTTATLGLAIGGTDIDLDVLPAALTLGAFAVGTIGADLGRRLGDRLSEDLTTITPLPRLNGDVGQLVKAKGRVLRVTLPDDIEDIEGYDPVAGETKSELAGASLLFPRRITVEELRERLTERLRADYNVGHVDVDVAEDGTVEYLAVGGRAAGLGPTLAPETVAVAIRADPAFSASPGDVVQIWRTDEGIERVARGEFRAGVEDVATVAVDAEIAERLDDESGYRLVTLPTESSADREFASLLRSAAETMSTITVDAGGGLVDATVGSLGVTVAAVQSSGDVEAIPPSDRVLSAGETVYAIGRPDALRRLEASATGPEVPTADA